MESAGRGSAGSVTPGALAKDRERASARGVGATSQPASAMALRSEDGPSIGATLDDSLPPRQPTAPIPIASAPAGGTSSDNGNPYKPPAGPPAEGGGTSTGAPTKSPTASPREEMKLLSEGREALDAGHPSDALALLRKSQELFPRGVLAEERDILILETLVSLGDHRSAVTMATSFAASYPHSVYLSRARSLSNLK
jgi:hypothetical protein